MSKMGFSRNTDQKVSSGRRRHSVESPSTSSKAPQKNMETMKILSNIKIPATMPVENQSQLWNACTQQNQGYFSDIRYESEWFQESSQQQPVGQVLHQTVTSTLETDIVDQALTAALKEVTQQSEKMSSEVTTEISEINALLVEPLSPWEDDHFVKPQSYVSTENKKEKTTTKSKSSRPIQKEKPSKKSKLQDQNKNVTNSGELMRLLEKTTPGTSSTNVPKEVVIVSDEEESMLSPDSDMTLIKQAKTLKRTLIKNKEEIDQEFKIKEEETNRLHAQISTLKKQLTELRECLSEMDKRRKVISKKLKLINEL